MRHMQVALPDQLIAEIDALVQDGWFNSQDELVRLALLEFIRRQGGLVEEGFQREDIAWALRQGGLEAP
jgi:Arc/MetJ-type ribon-helix-helix transcriptional regulator